MMGRTSSTSATYEIVVKVDGVIVAETHTSWDRSFGKCNRQTFHKNGEIFTRGRLRAWAKKYKLTIPEEIIAKFPTKVWWLE